jgi:putative membrane protein
MNTEPVPETILALERPHRALWTYYIFISIFTGPGIIASLPYFFFRYHTLRYRFDAEGIHMKVGILFRREVNLTYARIQDIHLRSGILQRWLGLANVQVQTASGSAGPELVIEGFKEYEAIRDFLYTRMRGYQTRATGSGAGSENRPGLAPLHPSLPVPGSASAVETETIALLLGIRDELRRTRELLETRAAGSPPRPSSPSTHV